MTAMQRLATVARSGVCSNLAGCAPRLVQHARLSAAMAKWPLAQAKSATTPMTAQVMGALPTVASSPHNQRGTALCLAGVVRRKSVATA